MAVNKNPMFAFGQNLTPEQVAYMRALLNQVAFDTYDGGDTGTFTTTAPGMVGGVGGKFGPSINWKPDQIPNGSNTEGGFQVVPDPSGSGRYVITQPRNVSTWGGNDVADLWDGETGQWIGTDSGATSLRGLADFAALSAASYGAVNALGGGGLGAAPAGNADKAFLYGDTGYGAGMTGAETAAFDAGMTGALAGNADKAALLSNAGYGPGMTGAQTSVFDAVAGATGSNTLGAAAANATGGDWMGALKTLGGATNWTDLAKLGMAAYGASQSKDQQQTSSRDPWAPAQPFLLDQLVRGAQLQDQYTQQPFSQAQQTAYGNVGGLLDSLNRAGPGLLQALQHNAGGHNQFVRGQQNRAPVYELPQWSFDPALLGNFGTRG
ncbi:MAG TPA: hypothetical protein PKO45_13020 [Rubrivivax sp.]|nr:hypothetical protein [Rubrivivax sp.]